MSSTKLFTSAMAVFVVVFSCHATSAQESSAVHGDAAEAAKTFLALVDQGKYSESWEACATALKEAVKKDAWQGILSSNRAKLGRFDSRRFDSEDTATGIPGAPDGQYVLLAYYSSFTAGKKTVAVTEIVTVMQDEDKRWRVFRYTVRKGKVPLH